MDSKQVLFHDSGTNFSCNVDILAIDIAILYNICYYHLLSFNSFWLMPAFMLKKIVLGNFAKGPVDSKMADAIDFMVDRVSV